MATKGKVKENRVGLKFIREFGGVKWWEYDDFMQAPSERLLSVQIATSYAEIGLTKEEIVILCEAAKERHNEKKFDESISVVNYLHMKALQDFDEEAMLKLACSYYVIDGENHLEGYDLGFEEQKAEILKRNNEAKCFFLSLVGSLIKNFPKDAVTNIKAYIVKDKENQKIIQHLLRNASPSLQNKYRKLKSIYRNGQEKAGKD